MRPWCASANLAATAAGLAAVALSGCGSSPSVRSRTSPAPPSVASTTAPPSPTSNGGVVSASQLQHALLVGGASPRPTAASCRQATAQQIATAPFGATRRPVFSCVITVSGERAAYEVEVLANGCYVAERRRASRAIYGCGAG